MELKSSSQRSGGLLPPECVSDPDEKEISDDDDDDRNHKHRKRETRPQSLEGDLLDQALTQPYRKRNRIYENGQSDPQSHFNLDRGYSKFDKRRPPGVNFSRLSGEHGFGRGRGRNFQRDSRFGSIDLASQMAHPSSIQPTMFDGRGLPNVSNAQSAPWNGFGLLPAIPNAAIDAINPGGLPGILRPQLNSSLNLGIQRIQCRDFEERGFCLRGDMCPMEHGVNRIVVEDVQSLSQFNLPVSLSSAHTSAGSGFISSVGVSSGTLLHSRGLHNRTNKSALDDDLVGAANASGADVYDPDQPLWNNDGHETSTALLGLQPQIYDEPEPFSGSDLSEHAIRSSGASIGSRSTSSSILGRLNLKNKLEQKEKFDFKTKPSEYPESKVKEIHEPSISSQGISHLDKQNNGGTYGTNVMGSNSKLQNDAGANLRKSAQKAQRTLFVNHIPLKDNKKDNLLTHFRKFGDVIDIYIPANSERAFVQFSKREEAERALQAPDAVMGSRFIKLWWANRDSVTDNGTNSGNNVITARCVPHASGSHHLTARKDNFQYVASKLVVPKPPDGLVTVGNGLKPSAMNSPKAPPTQKNTENLELMKELRKKQEMLERKRDEFRRQLDKLAKQTTGVKSEAPTGQAAKKQRAETLSIEVLKDANAKSEDASATGLPLQADLLGETMVSEENLTSQRSITNSEAERQDYPNLKQTVRPICSSASSFPMNRFKLDNRPTAFRFDAPLPFDLANVVALREHFSKYGAVSDVEVENTGEEESPKGSEGSEAMKKCFARVNFVTRQSAERAFVNGKSWHGHILQFTWLPSSIPTTSRSSESSLALKGTLRNAEVQSEDRTELEKSESILVQKQCNSCKSSNELSGDFQRDSDIEVQSPAKSANYISLEADDLEIRDSEAQVEEENSVMMYDLKVDENLRASPEIS